MQATQTEVVHAMIDIETGGTSMNSVIRSIGATLMKYDTEGNITTTKDFYANIRPQTCEEVGLVWDQSTKDWWAEQGEAAKAVLEVDQIDLQRALDLLTLWLYEHKVKGVWANPPRFDFGILINAFTVCQLPVPWKHWEERDYRTISRVVGKDIPRPAGGVPHHALHDAINQAEHLNLIQKHCSFDLLV